MTPVAPGSVIGILGGGQLGRMLANAAQRLGFDVDIYCPEDDPPAARVAQNKPRLCRLRPLQTAQNVEIGPKPAIFALLGR